MFIGIVVLFEGFLINRKLYICVYAYAYMVKVISLSEEAYKRLKSVKENKSFSEVIIEFVPLKRKRDIMELFGVFKENAGEWKEIEKKIYEDRRKFKLRTYKI